MPIPTLDARANVDSLVGWPSGPRVVKERAWEDTFMTVPSAENAMAIEREISAVPHRAGTPADYKTAMFVQDRLKADGFQTQIVPFEVEFTGPLVQTLSLTAPQNVDFDLLEGEPGKHSAEEKAAGPAFMENSADGDVTAPLFYLNHGTVDDWKAFDDLHVTMPPGSIVLERLGGAGSRDPRAGANAYDQLMKHGVAGLIVYYDPADDGVYRGEPWPKGNWKNNYMAERIGGPTPGVSATRPLGDLTLPGQAPLPGVKHLAWEETPHSTIPELIVTQNVARALHANLAGPIVPEGWHDGFESVERVGDGSAKAHLTVKFERKIITIWNVIGVMKGATKPDEYVMIGSHRDAMTFGAIDPGSGTTVMMQDADGFKKLADAGWKPDRSIEIASWDGHELGLFGSLSLAYAHGDFLRKHVVQYINTDQLTTGPPFVASMSPELWAFGREIAARVPDIDGKPILDAASSRNPIFVPPGGGSDHMTFIYELGVPGSSTGYYGHFGAHHTAEDNIAGLATYDPGMKQAVATAQFTGLQAMRAAGAEAMPLRLADVPAQLMRDLDAAKRAPQFAEIDFTAYHDELVAYRSAAVAFDAQLLAAERAGDSAKLDALEAKAMLARDAFYQPGGLTYNKYWHTIDRVVAALPELNYAAYDPDNRDAMVKEALGRLIASTEKATSALTTGVAVRP